LRPTPGRYVSLMVDIKADLSVFYSVLPIIHAGVASFTRF